MNVLALCSGVGGLELGLHMATGGRARAVCYVEREAYAASVLLARMEDEALGRAPIWDDLTTFDAGAWRGAVDLVTAGFPCQPWSVAGKRKGTEDERWIWPAIVRIIRECGAPLVFLENVPGLYRHGLREVLSDLAELGFDAEWTSVRASDVGAPHRRARVFVLAYHHEHGREGIRSAGLLNGEWQTCGGDADGCDPAVADSEREGLEGRGHPRPQRFAFPPGPGDAEGWREWLAAGGPAPAESGFRRGADGPTSRVDRLRALGNAVVPAQAAIAFRILCGSEQAPPIRLNAQEETWPNRS